jgi:CubicO group peptidase (beta-lactamase class C family)
MNPISRRAFLSSSVRAAGAAAAAQFIVFEAVAQPAAASKYSAAFAALDRYVERYMREMNAPGMTLSIADKIGTVRVVTYGFSDVEIRDKVRPEHLFQIGSITKSFAALVLLQLVDEKKLDLHKPVLEYLPWLPINPRWPFTAHHLLTHSSGLPGNGPLHLSDPAMKYEQGFEPGKAFYYCNLGFDILGNLIERIDGRPWPVAVRERIFKPLGMDGTEAVITNEIRARTAKNYSPFRDDVPYPRHGTLAQAANFIFEKASGSIASTPADMARYMHALIHGGRGIVTESGFNLFANPFILAEEFGPKVQYGYGIAVDSLDGHKVLRHTGGMVSFMSAMQIDMDAGFGVFSSINAQQGYRPNPVAQFALRLMRAAAEGKTLPLAPEADDPMRVKNAHDYIGEYASPEGGKLTVRTSEGRLLAEIDGVDFELEHAAGDNFKAIGKVSTYFQLLFGRAKHDDPKSPVVEAAFGQHWYPNAKYSGPRAFTVPEVYRAFIGHYRNDEPWTGSLRVVLRKGKLWLDGVVPLEQSENEPNLFRLRDEPLNPETIRFMHVIDGKAQMIKFSGTDLWRMDTP